MRPRLRRPVPPSLGPPPPGPPTWDGVEDGRPRVLIEHADIAVSQVARRDLEERGYHVLACSGPRSDEGGRTSCPVLRQERCPAVADADVVVAALDPDRALNRVILQRIERRHPDHPVICTSPLDLARAFGDEVSSQLLFGAAVDAQAGDVRLRHPTD